MTVPTVGKADVHTQNEAFIANIDIDTAENGSDTEAPEELAFEKVSTAAEVDGARGRRRCRRGHD